MTATADNPKSRGIFSRVRGGRGTRVADFHEQTVQDEQRVVVTAEGVVVGDVVAPKVEIAGIVCGMIVAQEIHVRAGAQIWGDVYATTARLEETARIHGWFSSIDAVGYAEMANNREYVPDPDTVLKEMPAELGQHSDAGTVSPKHLVALRRLQTEAAVALAARAELEQSFDSKLRQEAGSVVDETRQLKENVRQTEIERDALRQQLDSIQTRLLSRETQLQTAESDLTQMRQRLQEMGHAAVQNEELLRWQELAEETEKLADEYQKALKVAQSELQESGSLFSQLQQGKKHVEQHVVVLREERDALQYEVEELQAKVAHVAQLEVELNQWQENMVATAGNLTELRDSHSQLQKNHTQTQEELVALGIKRDQLVQELRDLQTSYAKQEVELGNARAKVTQFENELTEANAQLEVAKHQLSEAEIVYNETIEAHETDLFEQAQTLETDYQMREIEYASRLEKLTKQVAEWEQVREEEIAELNAKYSAQLSDLEATHEGQITSLTNGHTEYLNSLVSQHMDALQTTQAALAKTQGREKELTEALLWLRTQRQSQKNEIAQLQNQLSVAQNMVNEQGESLAELTERAERFSASSKNWEEKASALTDELASANKRIFALNEEMRERSGNLEGQMMSRTAHYETLLLERANQFQADITGMHIEHNDEIKELKAKFIEEREKLVSSNRERVTLLKQELQRLKAQDEVNSLEIEQLRRATSTQSQQLAVAQTDFVEREVKMSRAQDEVVELKREMYKLRRSATARIRQLEQELKEINEKLDGLPS